MTFKDLAILFRKACSSSFKLKKFLFLFLVLAISGLIYLFFQGVSLYFTNWTRLPISFLPFFLVSGPLLAAETFILELYHREQKAESLSFRQAMLESWEIMLRSSYLALPVLVAFFLLWVLLAIFILLKAIPLLGKLFGIILAFGPFLINLGVLVLLLSILFLFFFVIPSFVVNKKIDRTLLLKKIRSDPFTHVLLLAAALLPVWIAGKIIGKAALMTLFTYSFEDKVLTTLQLFFVMLPVVALMTPAINFFFNFAMESYYWTQAENESHQESGADLE
ncbi:MAG: hypothetical protein WAM28_02080 [Chlamydiales bacterium]